ncbi:MAG: hypothetical protein HY565_03290 [Candidatus Kerfeldbacteria bacterium]|nr:hypothetical protein [Candidatus Kerfeldbacteria bacterium]
MTPPDPVSHPENAAERDRRERQVLKQAKVEINQWIQANSCPQTEAFNRNPTPQVLNLTDDQLAANIAEPALAQAPDMIMFPFTIDHAMARQNGSFALAGQIELQPALTALQANLTDRTVVVVVNRARDYQAAFPILGLHPVHETTIGQDHAAAFVRGEAVLTDQNIELLRQCDFKMGAVLSTVFITLDGLAGSIDDLGIQFHQDAFVSDQATELQEVIDRLRSRQQTLMEAVPTLQRQTDPRVQELGEQFALTRDALTQFISDLEASVSAARVLIAAYQQGVINDEVRAAIAIITPALPKAQQWYQNLKPVSDRIVHNAVYQAYRLITPQAQRG